MSDAREQASMQVPMHADPSALAGGDLVIVGQLRAASNATILCALPDGSRCVYKPVAGERPLWDFPDGTLAGRELAFAALDAELGIGAVPLTVWREEGPFGPGMCQRWVDESEAGDLLVDVVPAGAVPDGWVTAVVGEDEEGAQVAVVHRDDPRLAAIALLDAVANNADRKAGHLLVDASGGVHAIDHGVTFHADDKLRTVLWGWAGTELPPSVAEVLARAVSMRTAMPDSISRWLDPTECAALEQRIARIADEGRFPVPSGRWPAIPWPIY